jgi:hypothetical protein
VTRIRPAGLSAACLAGALLAMALPVRAESPFVSLGGSWSGSGQITLDNGKTESIRCRGYYNNKGSDQLGLAIRCASASNKIEMRADLNYSGGSVSGTWEERTFNATGTITGKASASRLTMAISGGVAGSMSVSLNGANQIVSINTEGSTLKGVSIQMSKG